jgi:fructose-1,6-bisphosphatase I
MSNPNPSAELEPPATDLITLTRHLLSQQSSLGERATGDLTMLLVAIQVGLSPLFLSSSPSWRGLESLQQVTSKYIASNVRKARLINLVGLAGAANVQGEDQKKLDVLSNDIMVNALRASGKCSVMVSEEVDEAIIVSNSKGT